MMCLSPAATCLSPPVTSARPVPAHTCCSLNPKRWPRRYEQLSVFSNGTGAGELLHGEGGQRGRISHLKSSTAPPQQADSRAAP
jgi:hypothetical protein